MTNPSNPKQAYGNRKLPVHLVPPALTLGAAVALGEGAVKYGPYNWRDTPVENMTYIGAILRHAFAYMDGEDIDPESSKGKTHLQGIAGCIAILLDSTELGTLIEMRPPPGPAPRLTRDPNFGALATMAYRPTVSVKPTELEELDAEITAGFGDVPSLVSDGVPGSVDEYAITVARAAGCRVIKCALGGKCVNGGAGGTCPKVQP